MRGHVYMVTSRMMCSLQTNPYDMTFGGTNVGWFQKKPEWCDGMMPNSWCLRVACQTRRKMYESFRQETLIYGRHGFACYVKYGPHSGIPLQDEYSCQDSIFFINKSTFLSYDDKEGSLRPYKIPHANNVDPDQTAPLGAIWEGSKLLLKCWQNVNME